MWRAYFMHDCSHNTVGGSESSYFKRKWLPNLFSCFHLGRARFFGPSLPVWLCFRFVFWKLICRLFFARLSCYCVCVFFNVASVRSIEPLVECNMRCIAMHNSASETVASGMAGAGESGTRRSLPLLFYSHAIELNYLI